MKPIYTVLILISFATVSCSGPSKNRQIASESNSDTPEALFLCEGGNLYEDQQLRKEFSGIGECTAHADGLNSGNSYYCIAESLYENLELKKTYAGYTQCDDYVSDLNSAKVYRCEGGTMYKGLQKLETFASGWPECTFNANLFNGH